MGDRRRLGHGTGDGAAAGRGRRRRRHRVAGREPARRRGLKDQNVHTPGRCAARGDEGRDRGATASGAGNAARRLLGRRPSQPPSTRSSSRFGKIDILINAAGTSTRKLMVDHPDEMWHRMIDTNLTGPYRTIKLCLPGMIERRFGRIVNFASTAANVGYVAPQRLLRLEVGPARPDALRRAGGRAPRRDLQRDQSRLGRYRQQLLRLPAGDRDRRPRHDGRGVPRPDRRRPAAEALSRSPTRWRRWSLSSAGTRPSASTARTSPSLWDRNGERSPELAFWLETPSIAACEIAKLVGYRIVVIDIEHGVIGAEACDADRRTAVAALGLTCYVRVAAADRVPIQQALDSGADGVILPQIADVAHAREATAFAKYPPLGLARRRLQPHDDLRRLRQHRRRLLRGREPAHHLHRHDRDAGRARATCEAIAALETVDGLFIGPTDLSMTRGRGPSASPPRTRPTSRRRRGGEEGRQGLGLPAPSATAYRVRGRGRRGLRHRLRRPHRAAAGLRRGARKVAGGTGSRG